MILASTMPHVWRQTEVLCVSANSAILDSYVNWRLTSVRENPALTMARASVCHVIIDVNVCVVSQEQIAVPTSMNALHYPA